MTEKFSFSMVHSSVILLFCYLTVIVSSNDLFKKYITEENGSNNCGKDIPELVSTVINNEFKTKLVKILFDDLYKVDYNFRLYLNKIIKGLNKNAVIFGQNNETLKAIRENEQPAWIIFSTQPEPLIGLKGKILLILHISQFQLKEWLLTPMARRHQELIAISDPALKKFRGSIKDCDTGFYTNSMNTDGFGGSKAIILASWRGHNFTQHVKLFPSGGRVAYNGIHLVISAKNQPPFIFKSIALNREITWDGLEVRLIYLLKDILNFTMEFRDIMDKGHRYEVLDDLKQGFADLGVGGVVVTDSIYKSSSLIYPHSMDCAAFISLASLALPKYRAIMGPFLWDVWISITLCYFFAIIPIALSAWHTLTPLIQHPAEIENMFWYVFGTFTNCFTFHGHNSWSKGLNYSTKLFIGTYWVFTIIITACYTGSIVAFITLPVYPEVVDSMHQLLHDNYRVTTMAKEGWWELLTGSDDDEASGLAGTAETVTTIVEGLSTVIASAKEDKPVAFLGSSDVLKYVVKTNYTMSHVSKRQLFHISKQCFVPQMISMLLPLDSLYVDTFSKAIMKASEGGFITKIQRELEWQLYKRSVRQTLLQGSLKLEVLERQLTLDDTQGMFLLLACGFITALFALVFELGTWVKNREGEELTVLAKQKWLSVSKRLSVALLDPSNLHMKEHYPLYFRTVLRRRSSLFGSIISSNATTPDEQSKPPTAVSDTHLMPTPVEKPIRLLSF